MLDYKKKERAAEVKELEERLDADHEEACKLEAKLAQLRETDAKVDRLRSSLDTDPDYQLPEPQPFMSAKNYMAKHAKPLFDRLKKLLLTMVVRYMELKRDYEQLVRRYNRAVSDKEQFSDRIYDLAQENRQLKMENRDYRLLRKVFGDEQIDRLVVKAKDVERPPHHSRTQDHVR